MSQSRQSNAMATAPAGTSQEADTLVEAYAEDLMDEIFDDVDRILAGDATAIYADPIEPAQEPQSDLRSEPVTVPAMIVPVFAQPAVDADAQAPLTETQLGDTKTDTANQSPNKSGHKRHWRNFMLSALGLSAIAAVGIWWLRQQPTFPLVKPSAVSTTPPPASSTLPDDAAFGEYLKRSLRVISGERSAQVETQTPGAVASAPSQPANSQASGQRSNNVIERVFVPLLQPGSGANQNRRPNTNTVPPSATPNAIPNNAVPNVVTLPPTLPAPNTAIAPSSETNTNEPIPNIATNNSYELVGVLELGDRSAALFEVNGSSQRVYIGETIGGSGWSIVSINNEEVVVRRNGEVRSIYIGQQF